MALRYCTTYTYIFTSCTTNKRKLIFESLLIFCWFLGGFEPTKTAQNTENAHKIKGFQKLQFIFSKKGIDKIRWSFVFLRKQMQATEFKELFKIDIPWCSSFTSGDICIVLKPIL